MAVSSREFFFKLSDAVFPTFLGVHVSGNRLKVVERGK